MALTQVSTGGIKDGTISNADLDASAAIDPSKINGTAIIDTDSRLTDTRVPTDGSVTNAKIASDAAISGSKISPDFGAQNITTTGTVTGASLIPSSSTVPTNGVYLPAANSVAISTSGTGRLLVDADGNVTVSGAVQPKLRVQSFGDYCEIKSDGNGSVILDADPDNSATDSLIRFLVDGGEKARIDSSGRLGLGTSTPGRLFTVKGSASGNFDAAYIQNSQDDGSSDSVSINLGLARTGGLVFEAAKIKAIKEQAFTGVPTTIDAALAFETIRDENTAERMRITSAGNVGVGTTSPSALFTAAGPIRSEQSGNRLTMNHDGINGSISTNAGHFLVYADGANSVIVHTDGSERFRITNTGAFGLSGANYGTSGQVLTSNGSASAPSWQTPAASVDALGAVGSYGFFYYTSGGTPSPGSTTAGSNLQYSNAHGSTASSSPSGTWRVHGLVVLTAATNSYVTLWIRIS